MYIMDEYPMRLLIVDDEIEFARYVATVAEGLGFETEIFDHAHPFQEACRNNSPDAVLVDMVMPDMDGIELVTWLSQRGATAHLMVATGYNPKYAEMAEILGAQSTFSSITKLQKPIRAVELREVLTGFLESEAGGRIS